MTHNRTSIYQVSELQLVYKQRYKPSERPKITTSLESYNVLLDSWNVEIMGFIEEFKILLLNRAHRVIGFYEVSCGGICGTVADPRVIFAAAIKCSATSIILAHNHPSGSLTPSFVDIQLTNKLKEGGRLLDIDVLDHIILTDEAYFSFADQGMM